MTPVTIDPELVTKLREAGREVPLVGPDGSPAGFYLSAETYHAFRKAAYDRAFAEMNEEELRAALANPKRYTMAEVIRMVEEG